MFNLCRGAGQICVRQDLIEQELKRIGLAHGATFKPQKLTNRFIDWLFRRYETIESSIHFYDEEPEVPENATPSEIHELYRGYEECRMTFNNWVDPIGYGIWNMTQHEADKQSREWLITFRSLPVKKNGRVWYANTGDMALIYCYGRDFSGVDYWFLLRKKGSSICA